MKFVEEVQVSKGQNATAWMNVSVGDSRMRVMVKFTVKSIEENKVSVSIEQTAYELNDIKPGL